MATAVAAKVTYNDYARLPEGAPYQLIDGELIMSPAPIPFHQDISNHIEIALSDYLRSHNVGKVYHAPIDVQLSEHDTYQPDIIFISRERLDIIGETRIHGAPDLVIEILSPSTAYYDLRYKKRVYEAAGVHEYWIVDPMEQSVEIYWNTEEGFILHSGGTQEKLPVSRLLKSFSMTLEAVFAR